MTLVQIYKYALINGLTAKEAGARFSVKWDSILKKGHQHKLPKLKTEAVKKREEFLQGLKIDELVKYKQSFISSNEGRSIDAEELKLINNEITRREDAGLVTVVRK